MIRILLVDCLPGTMAGAIAFRLSVAASRSPRDAGRWRLSLSPRPFSCFPPPLIQGWCRNSEDFFRARLFLPFLSGVFTASGF